VGYCHAKHGCKIATDDLSASNGITASRHGSQDVLYVSSVAKPEVVVLERQTDGTAVLTDVIAMSMFVDNLSVDAEGVVWGAGK
jgi:arylesterase / paraoxonase